jgi:hypothetical protein
MFINPGVYIQSVTGLFATLTLRATFQVFSALRFCPAYAGIMKNE